MKGKKWLLGLATISALALAACGNGGSDNGFADNGNGGQQAEKVSGPAIDEHPEVTNDGEPIKGGTLKVALVADSPFQGLLSPAFEGDNIDDQIVSFETEPLFYTDNEYKVTDEGAATQEIDEENKTVTYKLRDNLKWSDGEPVTADDVIFAHEVVASPDYTGLRYDSEKMGNIQGVKEYHDGKADHISGIEKIDDKTLAFHLNNMNVDLEYGFGGPFSYALPKHQLKDIPVKDMESSPEIRQHPIGFGPFEITQVVDGESVEYKANEYYYGGRPKIDKIELTRVPSSGILAAVQNHQYDLVFNMPSNSFDQWKELPGYQYATKPGHSYSYMGFKLGKWDKEKGENVPDPNMKMSDPKLRQAMGYALDNDTVGTRFYQGLSWNANSRIVPDFNGIWDPEQEGFYYDPEKSKKILDDAGYKDTDNDSFRETPEGKQLVINMALPDSGETAEPLAQYYKQAFEQIGLNAQLLDGRLQEGNNFYDRIQKDDPEIDVYFAAWGTASNPRPDGLAGRHSFMNYTRFASEENDRLLDAMADEKSLEDENYYKQQFKDWQQYIVDEPTEIPLRFSLEVTPVNNRVKKYSPSPDDTQRTHWNELELTADAPKAE
ncbi:MAG: oligopeptide ABC transporter substrate-binding protein [Aerococcus sp.]|nr:oligopeptide ABC transporter substrate-binding protein [Aerococcus sp.]